MQALQEFADHPDQEEVEKTIKKFKEADVDDEAEYETDDQNAEVIQVLPLCHFEKPLSNVNNSLGPHGLDHQIDFLLE